MRCESGELNQFVAHHGASQPQFGPSNNKILKRFIRRVKPCNTVLHQKKSRKACPNLKFPDSWSLVGSLFVLVTEI